VLFHIPAEVGYRFDDHTSLSAYFFEHMSNAYTVSPNEGMDRLGIRYGYRFQAPNKAFAPRILRALVRATNDGNAENSGLSCIVANAIRNAFDVGCIRFNCRHQASGTLGV
jgi:hypothetical protein